MTNAIPTSISTAKPALRAIVHAVGRMPQSSRALWRTRLSHIYGDMGGQRGVELSAIGAELGLDDTSRSAIDIVVGLETYFALACNLLAMASVTGTPSNFLANIATYDHSHLRSFIERSLSGEWLDDEGFHGSAHAFDFTWLPECLSRSDFRVLGEYLSYFQEAWSDRQCIINGLDPLQKIHHDLFPKNLLHITGQFYTPPWLAELLLDDLRWSPNQRIMDPFCGSGIFLLSAYAKAKSAGCSRDEALRNMCGIDLSPSACIATRSNIIIYSAQHYPRETSPAYLNIICADSLAPSIVKGRNLKGAQFDASSHQLFIDGELVDVSDRIGAGFDHRVGRELAKYGMPLENWIADSTVPQISKVIASGELNARNRRIWEQLAVFCLRPSECVVTNPPWVGWEYISRPYRDAITPAWLAYDLFKARGLNAAFLKEDLSSLALLSAWDLYLSGGGKSAVVLRPAVMRSDLTARGVRRLSLGDDGTQLSLTHIREFSDIRVFSEAGAETATWQIVKGKPTAFPIKVTEWSRREARWSPDLDASLSTIVPYIREVTKVATRTTPEDAESRWVLSDPSFLSSYATIQGTNQYTPRMGVFTGGANGVFYLRELGTKRPGRRNYQNIVERAKRAAPQVEVELEPDLILPVIRGRDIQMWNYTSEVCLLCPHNENTKMYPIEENVLKSNFPQTYKYLSSMKEILISRNGFAGWEKTILERYFYTLQRVGAYTFAPYKVCWKYIASEFTTCVLDAPADGGTFIPNDKVMFIPFHNRDAAYFLCGILSSKQIRQYINNSASHRQMSTTVIKSLNLPEFASSNELHRRIATICMGAHQEFRRNKYFNAASARANIDDATRELFA